MSLASEWQKDDCLACRVVCGGGLVGCAGYVAYGARKYNGINKCIMLAISAGLLGVGIARGFNLPPFFKTENHIEDVERKT